MELRNVEEKGQLSTYYTERNLHTTNEKINRLTIDMEIKAARCDEAETPDEVLAGLEDLALLGYWKAFSNGK